MRHAYIITAYNNFPVLHTLLRLLDDPRNDIYLHVDRRTTLFDDVAAAGAVRHSRLFLSPRINVYWGHFTQITAILSMLQKAVPNNYSYYHVLSGSDLPLTGQDEIHSFFEKHAGQEFVGFADTYRPDWVTRIHILSRWYGSPNRYARKASRLLGRAFIRLQEAVGYDHTRRGMRREFVIRKGSDWYSISHEFACHLLAKRRVIAHLFRFATIPTEFYCQTILWNSPFRDRIYDLDDELRSSMRLIDWTRGGPYVFREADYDALMRSDRLFARKFDWSVDAAIVTRVHDAVSRRG